MQRAPIVPVSSLTGAGLEGLKRTIADVAGHVGARDSQGLVRLPIDRVFTMKGFGTVVTGTLIGGTIRLEDELEVFPTGRRVRIRGVQVHGDSAAQAVAGQRTALNLAGASTEDLARGMTLVPSQTFEGTRVAEVQLRLLASAPRVVKQRARVHFHSYTMETVAEIVLTAEAVSDCMGIRPKEKPAGATGPLQARPGQLWLARVKLPEKALLLPFDHFIVRQLSPVVTIGGGFVYDPAPLAWPKENIDLDPMNAAMIDPSDGILGWRIARHSTRGISLAKLVSETGLSGKAIESQLSPFVAKGLILRTGNLLLYSDAVAKLDTRVVATISEFHKANPLVAGIGKETLREKFNLSPDVLAMAIESLAREKKLEIAGDLVRLTGHGVVMKDEEAESKKKIEDVFLSSGLKVPALPEVIAGLKIDRARAQKIVTLLMRDKVLVKISDDLVFHRGALEVLRRQIVAFKTTSLKIDVGQFKALTGVSRKYAIPLLEYLDRERVTRRVGDAREIL
jgi:selenocysteine-specific elongation factor